MLLGALALLRELAASRPDHTAALLGSPPHLYTYLAAGGLLGFWGRGWPCAHTVHAERLSC